MLSKCSSHSVDTIGDSMNMISPGAMSRDATTCRPTPLSCRTVTALDADGRRGWRAGLGRCQRAGTACCSSSATERAASSSRAVPARPGAASASTCLARVMKASWRLTVRSERISFLRPLHSMASTARSKAAWARIILQCKMKNCLSFQGKKFQNY